MKTTIKSKIKPNEKSAKNENIFKIEFEFGGRQQPDSTVGLPCVSHIGALLHNLPVNLAAFFIDSGIRAAAAPAPVSFVFLALLLGVPLCMT